MTRPTPSLTEGSIPRTLFFFTLPILFGNVLQSLNGSINSIWIGHYLGEAALTASSNANSLLFLLIGSIFGVSIATTILVGQSIGARDVEQAKRVIGTCASFFALVSTAIAGLGFLFSAQLLGWMHMPADALPFATAYLKVIFLGIPSIYLFSFVMMSLRGAGDSKTPFYFLLVSVALDIALNPLLIFGWGPIPALGIAGSATATLIAQNLSLFGLLAYVYRTRHFLRLERGELRYLKIEPRILGVLVAKGVPMGLQMIVLSSSMLALISLVNRFGSQTTAAYGACFQLWNYIQMPAFAVGQAVSSMAAQNVGARRWDRVHRVALSGVAFNLLLTGALIAAALLLDRRALGLFLTDPASVLIGQHINAIVIGSFLFFGVTFTLTGVVRATGAVIPPLIMIVISLWVVRVPFARLLLDRWHADAIWWSFPTSALLGARMAVAYYRFGQWRSAHMLVELAPVLVDADEQRG